MPLIHGKSKASFEKNLKTEMESGKPMKQALAIAYATKRRSAKKMAEGGSVSADKAWSEADKKAFSEGASKSKPQGFSYLKNLKEGLGMAEGGEVNHGDMDDMGGLHHPHGIAIKIMLKKKMAEGGEVKDGKPSLGSEISDNMRKLVHNLDKGQPKKMAHGGMAEAEDEMLEAHHPDDDFLSDEEQTPYFHEESEEEDEANKRKGMIHKIMRGLSEKHMGK